MAVQERDQQQDKHKLAVFIAYNGMNASFDYNPERLAEVFWIRAHWSGTRSRVLSWSAAR